jgi:hypothetical protein
VFLALLLRRSDRLNRVFPDNAGGQYPLTARIDVARCHYLAAVAVVVPLAATIVVSISAIVTPATAIVTSRQERGGDDDCSDARRARTWASLRRANRFHTRYVRTKAARHKGLLAHQNLCGGLAEALESSAALTTS